MALPKIAEARELDDQALETAIVETKRKLFDLRFQQATRQLEGGLHQFKHERHRLAQLMTVLRERQLRPEPSSTSADGNAEADEPQLDTTSASKEA
jgi:large subunit ribosomal protein L29